MFLHPSQRLYVEHDYHGPFRLLGGAGTGKTVVAMHRAKRLAARLLRSGSRQKVLFTTYSRNLATDIASNLKLICTPDEFNTIDVVNLDKLVKDLLTGHGYSGEVWYDGISDYGNDLDAAWRKAIASIGVNDPKLTVSFFKSELSQVIVPQQVRNAADYMRVLRKGRGTRLNRAQEAGRMAGCGNVSSYHAGKQRVRCGHGHAERCVIAHTGRYAKEICACGGR